MGAFAGNILGFDISLEGVGLARRQIGGIQHQPGVLGVGIGNAERLSAQLARRGV